MIGKIFQIKVFCETPTDADADVDADVERRFLISGGFFKTFPAFEVESKSFGFDVSIKMKQIM